MARGKPCLIQSPICNHNPDTTVSAHGGGVANGKGMGYKVSDHLSVWSCSDCNHYTDAYNGATKDEKRTAWLLGHQRQIQAWRDIVNQVHGNEKQKDIEAAIWALGQLGVNS